MVDQRKWTVMVWMAGDNDLEDFGVGDIQEGTSVGGTATIYASGGAYRAEVKVNAPPKMVGDPSYGLMFTAVLMHELGHTLGLDHATRKDDLMYSAVDKYPPSYSLPSTLDLYALWLLSSGTNQRSVSLPGSIPYALPPWVSKDPAGNIVLSYSGYSVSVAHERSFHYPERITQGDRVNLQLTLKNTGPYLFRITDVTLNAVWIGKRPAEERCPILLKSGNSATFTWTVIVPENAKLGEHEILIDYGISSAAHDGWGARIPNVATFRTSVMEAQKTRIPTITGATTIELPTQIVSSTTSGRYVLMILIMGTHTETMWTMSTIGVSEPVSSSSLWFLPLAILGVTVLFVCLIYMRTRIRKTPTKTTGFQPTPKIVSASATLFCRYCGAKVPRDSVFCETCGKKLARVS